ncbi:hypothetical protein K431DRAFT_281633 [Polychaeton citri CBS 116435]|uniref:ferric-chelate reductase (NADPH) n=1 Tax=Polychaeton citri CBS 116435 TaxID=1314669 RepID=A0A9P4UTF5_9PEZI|nr:hypothetical protein K431DRAFT_281633 [Polychaeton citri CBS 116435]
MSRNSIKWTWPENPDQVNITLLPLSDPLCANNKCHAFAKAHKASQGRMSWASQFLYGEWVSWYYLAVLGTAMILYCCSLLRAVRMTRKVQSRDPAQTAPGQAQADLFDRAVALCRAFSYRRASGALGRYFGQHSLLVWLLIAVSFALSIVACFAQHPYYRESRGYGSPPLGVRAGLAGVAMTPITLALSGKYNLVTMLTGISYEKLNVLHRWAGYIYLFFGTVHTVPFLVNALASGGWKRVYYQIYYVGSYEYTGIAPFAVLVFLSTFSIPWIRRKRYEIFKHSHVLAALAFLGTMFWHAGNEGNSWYYLYVTVAIWVIQLYGRLQHKMGAFERRRNALAQVEVLENASDATKVMLLSVSVADAIEWSPGQHVFLRFPSLGLIENHPLTIASLPKMTGKNEMRFIIRPYDGLTGRLYRFVVDNAGDKNPKPVEQSVSAGVVKARAALPMLFDGPYGGIPQSRSLHQRFDRAILVCGGGGISTGLPWLKHFAAHMTDYEKTCKLQTVVFIWCIRRASMLAWCQDEITRLSQQGTSDIRIRVYVTGGVGKGQIDGLPEVANVSGRTSDEQQAGQEIGLSLDDKTEARSAMRHDSMGEFTPRNKLQTHYGRPNLDDVLDKTSSGRRNLIIGCGPESMKIDLSNAAARLQSRVHRNLTAEVALHTETFGW